MMIFVCVFLPCLYWLVIVDSWRDIIFLWWFVCYLCEKLRSLLYWLGGQTHRMLKENVERKMDVRRRQEGWGVVEWWRKKVGKADWERRWKEVVLNSLENLHQSQACFSQDVLKQAWLSWSRGHWIVLAISFISRHCNTLDCVDK